MTSVAPAINGARPPVAITSIASPRSALDALDETLDQPDIAPEYAGLHGWHGAPPDHGWRAPDPDTRQLRRRHVERPQRQIDAGRNHTTAVVAQPIDDVEGSRRAKVEDDQWRLVAVLRGDRVGDAIGADLLLRHVNIDTDAEKAIRTADHQRLAAEIALAQAHQVKGSLGDDAADDRRIDVARRKTGQFHQLDQPDRIFVGGSVRVGRRPPRAAQLVAGIDGANHVCVSGVDGKQHAVSSAVGRENLTG